MQVRRGQAAISAGRRSKSDHLAGLARSRAPVLPLPRARQDASTTRRLSRRHERDTDQRLARRGAPGAYADLSVRPAGRLPSI